MHTETSEGLPVATALLTYSRNRFIVNLLPLLRQATFLRRVVTAAAAGKEGPVSVDDFKALKVSALSARGHASSLVTLSLEALAKKAPDVTFIHNFPGPVKTNFLRGGQGAAVFIMNGLFKLVSPFMNFYSIEECGERHLFLATSARYVGLGVSPCISILKSGLYDMLQEQNTVLPSKSVLGRSLLTVITTC